MYYRSQSNTHIPIVLAIGSALISQHYYLSIYTVEDVWPSKGNE